MKIEINRMTFVRLLISVSFFLSLSVLLQFSAWSLLLNIFLTVLFFRTFPVSELVKIRNLWLWSGTLVSLYFFYCFFFLFIICCRAELIQSIPHTTSLPLLTVVTFPFVTVFTLYFLKGIKEFVCSMNRVEILTFWAGFVIFATVLLIVSSQTSFFTAPGLHWNQNAEEKIIYCNHFLGSDTGAISSLKEEILNHPYFGLEGFRHPFFHLLILVISPLIGFFYGISRLFTSDSFYALMMSLSFCQIVQHLLSGIFLAQLCERFCSKRIAQFIMIFYICSFTVVWTIVPERLISSSFWLLVAVWYWNRTNAQIWPKILFTFLAVGSCLMSWALIVWLVFQNSVDWSNSRSLAQILHQMKWKPLCLSGVLASLLVFHVLAAKDIQGTEFTTPPKTIEQAKINTIQYMHMIENLYIPPEWYLSYKNSSRNNSSPIIYQVTWSLVPPVTLILGGLGILGICFSILFYWRDLFVQTAALWWLVSIGVLWLLGFSVSALNLYVPYFSWALVPLSLIWLNRIEGKWIGKFFPVLPCLALGMLCTNLHFIFTVTNLVKNTYPVP